MKNSTLITLIGSLVALCTPVFAQSVNLSGIVTGGPDKLPIRDAVATLRATDGADQQTTHTTKDGSYSFSNLLDGKTYRLTDPSTRFTAI